MKLKPKGRKIYRYKTRFERVKGFLRNSGAVTMTIAGIAVLVFVGYSAGGPIMKFLEEQEIITAPTEPPVSLAESEPSETSAASVGQESEAATEPVQTPQNAEIRGYYLDAYALSTEQSLRSALETVPSDITHIIVPLKTKGGNFYYATSLEDVAMSGAVIAALPLETIHSVITESGFIPAAVINTLEDHIYPNIYKEASYHIVGTEENWLDAAPENDGRPWLSPFSSLTKDFLFNVTEEIADAGFSPIICEGIYFPQFSENDLALLDPRAGAVDRGTALAEVANAMQEAAGDAAFYVTIDGEALRSDGVDLMKSGKPLTADGYVVTVTSETSEEIKALTADMPAVLRLDGSGSVQQVTVNGSYLLHPVQETTAPEDVTETEPTE